jgi:hypothetical protein
MLFHGRADDSDPPSPEWLSFNYEMAYGIFGTRHGPSFVRTYRAVEDLTQLLYVDGMSPA